MSLHHMTCYAWLFAQELVSGICLRRYVGIILLSVVLCLTFLLLKHWIANNLLGFAFAVNGIELLHLNSVVTGCILLGGLFFYDIFWVFGTNVMVTVAKSFEAPIKCKFWRMFFALHVILLLPFQWSSLKICLRKVWRRATLPCWVSVILLFPGSSLLCCSVSTTGTKTHQFLRHAY